ncbi:hypothetical protein MC7420_1972 [Coleofasciculus chthonoplastes PCC 7420]|uniref:Uncharacterized protein n=1 Tax=Coleofasciculus chthonoplastes PCC 7420 TaxID=118168 RepID=B4VN39_9CYAN|nr:hypothetical protein [Coleofasciculus chthonoplastes]EDX76969.1 hypothetical protein MC7420_1972 [Coleofasciculus chthonoplastes PCC 7420]
MIFINPYLAPKIQGIKDTFLDVKAKLTDETTVGTRTRDSGV